MVQKDPEGCRGDEIKASFHRRQTVDGRTDAFPVFSSSLKYNKTVNALIFNAGGVIQFHTYSDKGRSDPPRSRHFQRDIRWNANRNYPGAVFFKSYVRRKPFFQGEIWQI